MTNQPPVGRFIDPFTDFSFKHIFGSEPNKDILIDFLNALFAGRKRIRDLVYSPTEHLGEEEEIRTAIFDLLCTGENGEKFVVEMQRAEQSLFKDRTVFYTSRLINEQLPKGKRRLAYQLPEVYFVALLDFTLTDTPEGQYQHQVCLLNKRTCQVFYDKLEFNFVEIPKFAKTQDQLITDFDRWLYLLKNLSRLEKIPEFLNKQVFQRLFQIAEVANLNKEERMAYHFALKTKWDNESVLTFQREKGLAEGARKKALETARKMKAKGYSVHAIAEITELPMNEIEKLTQYQS